MNIIANIYTDFSEKFGVPRQSGLAPDLEGKIIFTPEYRSKEAVRGLEEFSHIWLIWGFSEVPDGKWQPTVRPPRLGGNKRVGVFASRSPFRPNGIGLSCVRIKDIDITDKNGPVIYVSGIDMVNGTPIYDIKPYIPIADCIPEASEGYTKQTKTHYLNVNISDELLSVLPGNKQNAAIEILKLDPRPSYIDDPERVYGVEFAGFDIKFSVNGNNLKVTDIVKSPEY